MFKKVKSLIYQKLYLSDWVPLDFCLKLQDNYDLVKTKGVDIVLLQSPVAVGNLSLN